MTITEIKNYMKEQGITQIQLAEKTNIPLETLRSIFCGRTKNPRIDTMDAIEEALGLKEKATDNTAAKIIADLQKIGLTKEKYLSMTEEQRTDLLQIIKVFTKNK